MRVITRNGLLIFLFIILIVSMTSYKQEVSNDIEDIGKLSMEEKLEDFEYLYSFISENYPYLKVNERVNGVNWLEEKENFESAIRKANTDELFMKVISKIVQRLNNGHTHVLTRDSFDFYYSAYADPKNISYTKPWAEVLKNEIVLDWYEINEEKLVASRSNNKSNSNKSYCKTNTIVPDEVAYIRIYQMNSDRIEEDGRIIRSYLEEVKDYDKLIIDIRHNSGGSDYYWKKNIVEPLANDELTVDNYVFFRGEYCKPFYKYRGVNMRPISELDKEILDSFPGEIKTDFDYYDIFTRSINPFNSIGFNGEIYLLVDEIVYSSAESFAAFCKDSGFATLVGETTGGDGIGYDPLFFSLPNSGIVIRYTGELCLNKDGTINEEVHTMPDIEMDATIGNNYEKDKLIQYIINN